MPITPGSRRRAPRRVESLEAMLERIGGQLAEVTQAPNLLRYDPHDKQIAFHSLATKHRLNLGGNRSGKSVAGTIEGLYHARGEHPFRRVPPAPTRGRVIGTDFTNGIELVLLPLWAQWTPPSMLINGSWEDSYHDGKEGKILTFANGSWVQFNSYEQSVNKFAGQSLHWTHFDEEPPKDIYDEARARVVDTDGDWWMTLTPVLGLDYIYDEVYKPAVLGRDHPELLETHQIDQETGLPLFGVVEVESYDNRHLKQSALDGYFSTLSEDARATRRSGKFVQISGAVFPDFNRDLHVIPGGFFAPRHGYHRIYESIDNGWRDHTAVLFHAVDPKGNVTTFDEIYVNLTLYSDIARLIKERRQRWGYDRPYITVGDPRSMKQKNAITGTNPRQEFARHGIGIATESINGDVEYGVTRMTQYLRHLRDPDHLGIAAGLTVIGEGGLSAPRVVFPKWLIDGENCPNLVRQLEKNRWRRRANASDEQTMNKLTEMQQTDNHATDSARFFFVLMPDLAPRKTQSQRDRTVAAGVADMLGAVNPDTGHDPHFAGGRRTAGGAWKYRPTTSRPGEFEGWEEG